MWRHLLLGSACCHGYCTEGRACGACLPRPLRPRRRRAGPSPARVEMVGCVFRCCGDGVPAGVLECSGIRRDSARIRSGGKTSLFRGLSSSALRFPDVSGRSRPRLPARHPKFRSAAARETGLANPPLLLAALVTEQKGFLVELLRQQETSVRVEI